MATLCSRPPVAGGTCRDRAIRMGKGEVARPKAKGWAEVAHFCGARPRTPGKARRTRVPASSRGSWDEGEGSGEVPSSALLENGFVDYYEILQVLNLAPPILNASRSVLACLSAPSFVVLSVGLPSQYILHPNTWHDFDRLQADPDFVRVLMIHRSMMMLV